MRVRGICAVFITVVAFALPAVAEPEGEPWTLSGRIQGSSNSAGLVLKADPTLGYSFNHYFQTYFGLPVYFVNPSSTIQTATGSGFMSGLGNAYVGFRLGMDREAVDFASVLEATAPTGDKANGFSTGRATIDWTNRFSHSFSSLTPFVTAGLANTVSDTAFFVRPFTSLGIVSHFDGGAKFNLSKFVEVGASAYAIRAAGQQTIISKTFKDTSTTSVSSGSVSPAMAKAVLSTPAAKSWARRISRTTTVFRHGLRRMRVQTWIFRLVTREARVTTSIRCSLESDSAWVNEGEENCHEESSYVTGFSNLGCIPELLFGGGPGKRMPIVVRVRLSARGTARASVTIMNKRRLVPMQKVLMTPMPTGKRSSTSVFKTTRPLRRSYRACCRRVRT